MPRSSRRRWTWPNEHIAHVDNGYDGHIWGLDLFVTQDVIGYVDTELAEKDGLLKIGPCGGRNL